MKYKVLPKPYRKRQLLLFRLSVGALNKTPGTEDAFVQWLLCNVIELWVMIKGYHKGGR